MAEGKPPNSDVKSFEELISRLTSQGPPTFRKSMGSTIVAFVHRCLTVDSNSRPYAKDLLMDPFIAASLQLGPQRVLLPLINAVKVSKN